MSQGGVRSRLRGRRVTPGLAALALTVLVATQPGLAQPPPPAPQDAVPPIPGPPVPEDPRRFRIGTSLRVQGEYNDNVFLLERRPREEFRETLTPTLSLQISGTELRVTAAYAPSVVHSSLTEGELRLFHLFDGDARYAVTERVAFNVADRFLRTDDPALVDPRSVRRGRALATQNTLTSGVTYRQDLWSLTPRYGFTLNRLEREDATAGPVEEQSTVQTVGLDGRLDVLRRNTLDATYEFARAAFDVGNDFTGHLGRLRLSRELDRVTTASIAGSAIHRDVRGASDVNIYRGDVGLRRDVGPRYAVEARLGYGLFEEVGGETDQGPEYLLRATYTGRSVRVTATGGESFQETFLETQNVGVTRTREGAAEVRYEVSDRLALVLQGRVADNRFLQSTLATADGQPRQREDLLIEGGLEIAWQLSRLLVLSVGYTRTSVDSNLRGFDYLNNRVRVGLTATYN